MPYRRIMRAVWMLLLLMASLLPTAAGAAPRTVVITEADGVRLQAKLFLPTGPATAPVIVALHGCGGPLQRRDDGWARLLATQGHAVLLPAPLTPRKIPPPGPPHERPCRHFSRLCLPLEEGARIPYRGAA